MREAYGNIRRFGEVYSGLIGKLFRFAPGKTCLIICFQIVGSGLQPLIILILHQSIGIISGEELEGGSGKFLFLGELATPWLLALLSISVFAVGALSAILDWAGQAGARGLGRRYRLWQTGEILEKISSTEIGKLALPGRLADDRILRSVAGRYGFKVNLAIVSLFSTIKQATTCVALLVALFVVNANLAMVVVIVIPIAGPIYYLLNRTTHRSSRNWFMKGRSRETSAKLYEYARSANRIPKFRNENRIPVSARFIETDPVIGENLQGMEVGRLGAARAKLYSGLVRALFIGLGLYTLGMLATNSQGLSMENVVVFLIALAMLQQSVTGLLSAASSLVWHSPMISELSEYLRSIQDDKARKESVKLRKQKEEKECGKRILVETSVGLARTSFHFLFKSLYKEGYVSEPPAKLPYVCVSFDDIIDEEPDDGRENSFLIVNMCDLGAASSREAIRMIDRGDFRKTLVFTKAWKGDPEIFDCLLHIDETGKVTEGDESWWRSVRAEREAAAAFVEDDEEEEF